MQDFHRRFLATWGLQFQADRRSIESLRGDGSVQGGAAAEATLLCIEGLAQQRVLLELGIML